MAVPAFSVFSAASELLVTAAVFHVLWRAWRHGDLRRGLLATVIVFETTVNVSYMVFRLVVPSEGLANAPEWVGAVAAGHGILSLLMLFALGGMAALAWRDPERGTNFFREHPGATLGFVALWLLSVGSGEWLFVRAYLV